MTPRGGERDARRSCAESPPKSPWFGPRGLLAQSVDLRAELAVLRTLGVPVLALTSERDRLIPRSAFEAVCETVGADRRVVSGGHAWLLADPDSFERVLASTIDIQVAEHTASRAANRRSEVERLLQGSHLSKNEILSLLGSAAPLWLLSESAPALAGDLVLCRPKLQKDEIRALARHIEASTLVRITIAGPRSPRSARRQRRRLRRQRPLDLQRVGVNMETPTARGSFVHRCRWGAVRQRCLGLAGKRLQSMGTSGPPSSPTLRPLDPVTVTVQGAGDRSIVKVVAPDEQGLLATVCRYFQFHDVNIETLQARTRDGIARDTFLVIGRVAAEGLKAVLQHPPALAVARDAAILSKR